MQEREDTTDLLILSHYSRWGQSISFIKKTWFYWSFPDLFSLYPQISRIQRTSWIHFLFGYVCEMLMWGTWTGLLCEPNSKTPSHFLSHREEFRQSEGVPRRKSLLWIEAAIKTGITKDALHSEDVTQASHPNLSPGFDGLDTLDDPSVCSAPLPIVGSREEEGGN